MRKTFLALAVGAAFAAPGAHADVTISGAINMGIEFIKSTDGTDPSRGNTILPANEPARGATKPGGTTNTGISSNYSNVTISSLEDLGSGLKLDFAFQMVMRGDTNEAVNGRNSHIGLTGDTWGGVWWGINENIYERYLYTIDPLDGAAGLGGNLAIFGNPGAGRVFADSHNSPVLTCAGGANVGNGLGIKDACKAADFYRRDEETIWYDSPNFNGFTFGAAIQTNFDKNNTFNHDPKMWQVGVKYVGPAIPFELWGAYAHHKDYFGLTEITNNTVNPAATPGASASSKDRAYQFGGAYTLGDIKIFALYEQLKYEIDGALAVGNVKEFKVNHWGLGVKWLIPTGYVGAQYLQAQDGKCEAVGTGCEASETGAKQVSAGYYHTLSKQTQAYIVAAWLGNKDLGRYRTAGINNPNMSVPGSDFMSIGVGLKHSF